MLVAGGVGIWATRLRRANSSQAVGYLSNQDVYLSVTLAWTLAALLGGLPFIIEGTFHSLLDSSFEAMSGFTTTGPRCSRTSGPSRHRSSSGSA